MRKRFSYRYALQAAVILLSLGAVTAESCTLPKPGPFRTLIAAFPEEKPRVDEPPRIERISFELQRAEGDFSPSCSDTGHLRIRIESNQREYVPPLRGQPPDVAYEFRVIDNQSREQRVPEFAGVALYPDSGSEGTYRFVFTWSDSAPTRQRTIELVLSITAVDRWGRRSEACDVTIVDPGSRSQPPETITGSTTCARP